MKLLAFAASNSRSSINKSLVTYAASLVENAEVDLIDLNDYEMPIFSSDRENESGIPQLAHDFYNKISAADAVMISFAEHNASYTAAYKNLFDWTSRIDAKVYQGKPAVLLATSPGPGGAANVLAAAKSSAPYFGLEVKADLSLAKFYDEFDMEKGELKNAKVKDQLLTAVSFLK
ncbi:MAG: NAD(P)H-dependent oxidoreductase [Oleispira sp.]|nr:NAD(P)H-dependent oxidoreductase [Oleispira sp.]MBL4881999.1 NAD(P)H-dependent oxidoreductase [Oleispira sp.]